MSINKFLDNNFLFSTDTKVSMESLVPALLLEDEGQVEVVSTEGFMDFFKKFTDWLFDDKPSTLKLQGGFFQRKSTIIKALEKTYLNPEWLAKRQVETRPIKMDRNLAAITVKGVIPRTRQDAEEALVDYSAKLKQVGDAYLGFLRNLDIELQRNQRKLTPSLQTLSMWDVQEVEDIINSLNARITVNYRTLFGDSHINRVISARAWSEKDLTSTKTTQQQIQPNTRDETVECCHILLQLADLWEFSKDHLADTRSLKGYKMLSDYRDEVKTYIFHHKTDSQTGEQVDMTSYESLVDILDQVLDIPGRLIGYHERHTGRLINGYATLIDKSVK